MAENNKLLNIRYFDSEEKAHEWLKQF